MAGKKGLIMGVANDHSIAWGMAKTLYEHGAELAFTYQGAPFKKRLRPLAEEVEAKLMLECDVADEDSIDRVFDNLGEEFEALDFVVHAIAFSNKDELKGKYLNTSLSNFLNTMQISCYSFTSVARRAADLMRNGGSLFTLTYHGAERVMPCYNVMGVAKAALETSVKYLAADLGSRNIRVNAVSAGPMKTLAGSAIGNARQTYKYSIAASPMQRNVELEELGSTALYLASDLSTAVTGEIHHVDCGFNIIGMPEHENLKSLIGGS